MDTVSNMIIAIKNASESSKEFAVVPYSKFRQEIANCLLKQGYLKSVSKKNKKKFSVLELGIVYDNNIPKINNVKRISKLSRRSYLKVEEIKPVRMGYGSLVLSTTEGILVDKEARKRKIGGEALFEIW